MAQAVYGLNEHDAMAVVDIIDAHDRQGTLVKGKGRRQPLMNNAGAAVVQPTSSTRASVNSLAYYRGRRLSLDAINGGIDFHNNVLIYSVFDLDTDGHYLASLEGALMDEGELKLVYWATCCSQRENPNGPAPTPPPSPPPPTGDEPTIVEGCQLPACIKATVTYIYDPPASCFSVGTNFTLTFQDSLTLPNAPWTQGWDGVTVAGWYGVGPTCNGKTVKAYLWKNTGSRPPPAPALATAAMFWLIECGASGAAAGVGFNRCEALNMRTTQHDNTPGPDCDPPVPGRALNQHQWTFEPCTTIPLGGGTTTGTAKGTNSNKTSSPALTVSSVSITAGNTLVVVGGFTNAATPEDWTPTCDYNGRQLFLATHNAYAENDAVVAVLWRKITANTTANVNLQNSPGLFNAFCMAVLEVAGAPFGGAEHGGIVRSGSSSAPNSGPFDTNPFLNVWLQGALVTKGPSGDAAGTWSNSFTSGQRVGTTGGADNTNCTLALGHRAIGAVGIYGAALTDITSRDWACALAAIV